MGWKERFTFRDRQYVEREVGGEKFRFYPNRMSLLTEVRDLSTPVAKAISILFADESRDSGSAVKRHREGDFYMEDITTDPVSTDMATFRQREKDRAIESLLNTVADTRSRILLGRLFMDSLQDEFPYNPDRPASEVEEFLYGEKGGDGSYTGLSLPSLVDLFRGWMSANRKVFGDSGEKMVELVRKRLESQLESESTGTSSTSGDSSKTPMSSQSPKDSLPNF